MLVLNFSGIDFQKASTHHQNYYFYLNWLNWFLFHIIVEGLFFILIGCLSFLSPSLGVMKISISFSFPPHPPTLLNYMPAECFPFTYDLNDLKSYELIGTFDLWAFSSELIHLLFFFVFFFFF